MPELSLALLQQENSPLRPVVQQALDQDRIVPRFHFHAPPLPAPALETACCWLWDLAGFSPEQMDSLARELSGDRQGVVVASPEPGSRLVTAVESCQALQLLVNPTRPDQVSAAITCAAQVHRRVIDLVAEREEVRQQVADRVVVEQAKRLVMQQRGISEPAAMRFLQESSRRRNQKLAVTARKILSKGAA